MEKKKLNDCLFYGKEVLRYKIFENIYPELNKIFNKSKYSVDFIPSDAAYLYYRNLTNQYYKKCYPLENAYQELLYNLGCLINDIKYNPSIQDIMYIYGYIYYNGYLSVDNKFKFTYPSKEFLVRKSFSVFSGEGVCRNIGDLFSDLLYVFSIESYPIITDRMTFESETPSIIEDFIKLTDKDKDSFEEEFDTIMEEKNYPNQATGNHFEVLVRDKTWQLLDPTTLCGYHIIKKENDYNILKYLRFWSLYGMGVCNLNTTISLYNLFKNKYLKLYYQEEQLKLQKECYNICEKNKQKIKTFHDNNLEYINLLNESIQGL